MGDVLGGCHSVRRLPAFCADDAPPLTPSSPSPAVCGIEKRCRASYVQPIAGSSEAKKSHLMKNSEKDRLAAAVVDRWYSFQNALAGARRGYPLQNSLSFADAARCYIEVTRDDRHETRRDVVEQR